MSEDAIVILKDDHKQIRKLFREFRAAGENAGATKGHLVERMIELLTVHTYLENEVMYPRVRHLLPDLEDDVLESYEEHHVADVLCMELWTMQAQDEHFDAKATVLIEIVEHHMSEEEDEWFPKVRSGLSRTQLRELGRAMIAKRADAPTQPATPSALKKTLDAIMA
jgi:hemerythrin superfamily protein